MVRFSALFLLFVPLAVFAQQRDPVSDAAAAFAAGDTATAIRLYREFLSEYSDAAEIRSNLAAALVRSGRFEEAIGEYKTALQAMPNNPQVRMNLALAYYKLGRIPEAMQELETLRKTKPLDVQAGLLMADCLLQSGKASGAVELMSLFDREFPENRAVKYMFGIALLRNKETERAQKVLDAVLSDGESAESAYLLGQAAYMAQNEVDAAKYLARAIQLNPKLPGAHSLYAYVLRSIGKPELAPEEFRKELEVNPYDFLANVETAMLLKQDRKLEEALAHIGNALRVRPADPGALYQRASLHSMMGRVEESRKEFEQLVKDYPDFAEAHAGLAAVYYRLKMKPEGDRERAAASRAQEENQRKLEEMRRAAAQDK